MFNLLERYFKALKHNGPAWGYYPEPSKSILVAHPQNLKAGELFGRRHGFKVCTGVLYLGGYIRDDVSKGDWLKKGTKKWERDIHVIRKMIDKYPQESYTVVDRVIQSEWIFLQRVKKDTVQAFTGKEKNSA